MGTAQPSLPWAGPRPPACPSTSKSSRYLEPVSGGSVRIGWEWFRLRPPASGDLAGIAAMWQRCSVATRLGRFHAPVRRMPPSYLETVGSDPGASVVAVLARTGAVAGLASLVSSGGGSAELGVLVEDAWQRCGIGRRLVAHLVAVAAARQITELTASVLAENGRLADALRRVPGEFSATRDGTTVVVRVRLPATGAIRKRHVISES